MTLEEIYAAETDWKDRLSTIRDQAPVTEEYIDEYSLGRKIRDEQVGKRLDKLKSDGSTVSVNKIPIPFQKHIVQSAASFIFGEPVKITAKGENIDPLLDLWESMRMDSFCLEACEQAKAFTVSAILFRIITDEDTKTQGLKANILDPRKGNIIPIWDSFEELDAVVWETKIQEGTEDFTLVYIYTKTSVQVLKEGAKGIEEISNVAHGFTKIPLVVIQEDQVEYEDVKHLIDRYEMRFSKFADTNDYFSSPFFKAVGSVANVPAKDDTGSIFMMDVIETDKGQIIQSDLDVISWDSAPESTKLEFQITKDLIYDMTSTPDLAFNNLKGIGSVTGVALKLMFLSAQIKAKYSSGNYKIAVKRMLSILIDGGIATKQEGLSDALRELIYSVEFNSILPDNYSELISMLSESTFNKPSMSQETAVSLHPFVENPTEEFAKIQAETTSENIGETFHL